MTSNYKVLNRINSQSTIKAKLAMTRRALLDRAINRDTDLDTIVTECVIDLFDTDFYGFATLREDDHISLKTKFAPLILFSGGLVPPHVKISDYDALGANLYTAIWRCRSVISADMIKHSQHPEIQKQHIKILCLPDAERRIQLQKLDIAATSVQSLFIALANEGLNIKEFVSEKRLNKLKSRITNKISDSFCYEPSFFVNVSFMFKASTDHDFQQNICKRILQIPDLYNYGIPSNQFVTPKLPWADWTLTTDIKTRLSLMQHEAINTPFGVPTRALADFKSRWSQLVKETTLDKRLDLIRMVLVSLEDSQCYSNNMLYRVAAAHINEKNPQRESKILLKMVKLICPELTSSIMLADSFELTTPRSLRHFLDSMDVPDDKPQPLTDFIFE